MCRSNERVAFLMMGNEVVGWKRHNYPHVLIMCHKLTEFFNQVGWKGQNL
ncbi:hypothetical protein HanIR_Chr16g0835891 [Helianthus annuus]|nr:hypothetical protein HanIR_Chr16g0835891 [Helianthus annuus]